MATTSTAARNGRRSRAPGFGGARRGASRPGRPRLRSRVLAAAGVLLWASSAAADIPISGRVLDASEAPVFAGTAE
ncbi:MAG: hypothetical protein AAGF23_17405, partial [Acidobacteriota bacterium]